MIGQIKNKRTISLIITIEIVNLNISITIDRNVCSCIIVAIVPPIHPLMKRERFWVFAIGKRECWRINPMFIVITRATIIIYTVLSIIGPRIYISPT